MKGRAEPSRLLCFRMLTDVFDHGGFSNLTVRGALLSSGLTPVEKSFATALFYGIITRKYTLNHYLKKNLRKKFDTLEDNVHTLLLMGAFQLIFSPGIPAFAAVNETVRLAKLFTNEGGVRLVNAVLRTIDKDFQDGLIQPGKEKFDVRFSLNRELSGCLVAWYGKERAEKLGEAFLASPHVSARVNRRKNSPEELIAILQKEGVPASPGTLCPDAIVLQLGGRPVTSLASFSQGRFMIQDEAAMLASFLIGAKPGDHILDVCSAPGGKACHMAECMDDVGNVLALDSNESRILLVEENQKRLGLSCIDTAVLDALTLDQSLGDKKESFDKVLCDVPCSGLGLIHRKPDIRHTMTYEKMADLVLVQQAILASAARFVAPGGTLMYSTCTINPHENQEQAGRFLLEHPEFEEDSILADLPESLRTEHHIEEAQHGQLSLFPDTDGCDGFFIARFRRQT